MTNPTQGAVVVNLDEAVVEAAQFAHQTWVTQQQAARVERILLGFARFCRLGYKVTDLGGVTPEIAEDFVKAPESDGREASLAKRHLRRTALRLMFRYARAD